MQDMQEIDIEKFQAEVLENVHLLKKPVEISPAEIIGTVVGSVIVLGGVGGIVALSNPVTSVLEWIGIKLSNKKQKEELKRAVEEAQEVIEHKKVIDYICPALLVASGDVFKIAQIITPILADNFVRLIVFDEEKEVITRWIPD